MGTSVTVTGITFPDATTQTTAASSAFPAGTLMLFQQTAAPTGWTKQTTHDNKALRVVSGVARITIDDVTKDYHPGDTVLIPLGAKHRMANPKSDEEMILIEVQTGTYFGEDDIVRVEDDYDRPESHVKNLWKPEWDWNDEESSNQRLF